MNFGQGKVSEKSGNFVSDLEWAPCIRPLVKNVTKNYFLISQPKHTLWVLKKHLNEHPKHYYKTDG